MNISSTINYDDNTYYFLKIIRWKVIERRQNMYTLAVAVCVDVMGSASGRHCHLLNRDPAVMHVVHNLHHFCFKLANVYLV